MLIQSANINLFQRFGSASLQFFMLYTYNKGFLHGITQKYAALLAPLGSRRYAVATLSIYNVVSSNLRQFHEERNSRIPTSSFITF